MNRLMDVATEIRSFDQSVKSLENTINKVLNVKDDLVIFWDDDEKSCLEKGTLSYREKGEAR